MRCSLGDPRTCRSALAAFRFVSPSLDPRFASQAFTLLTINQNLLDFKKERGIWMRYMLCPVFYVQSLAPLV
jgi:hypothetical protein